MSCLGRFWEKAREPLTEVELQEKEICIIIHKVKIKDVARLMEHLKAFRDGKNP